MKTGVDGAWRALAASERWADAIDAAETAGFDRIVAAATASDLELLGDAGRFARRPERARAAYEALRARFPSDERAAAAAFRLGKLALELSGAPAEAARWFEACLAERPDGPLAREAAGRRLEALVAAADGPGAATAARAYLARWPDGPHAAEAWRIAGEK